MSQEMVIPFQIGPNGGIVTTDDPVKQAVYHLMSIVGTNPLERPMRPTYGVPTAHMVFDSADDLHVSEMKVRIADAVRAWEPKVRLVSVDLVSAPAGSSGYDGSVIFQLRFSLIGNADVHEATIQVGGTVTERTTEIF